MTRQRPTNVLGLAAAIGAAAFAARAASGPDVIVGDLSDLAQYTTPDQDPQAYAIGTTSCNIGDDLLQWVSFDANHPVIGQGMFRLSTIGTGMGGVPITRIEQIGQSWLKHGFLALSGSQCQFCPADSPSGPVLGVGCSDPYSAGLNGSQESLGPRSEVNPSTGVFPFPISWATFPDRTGDSVGDPPLISGAASRRVRVARADLTTAGATYFVEGQYVAADDAAAGNKHNNASYRRIIVEPSTLGVGLLDSTQRTKPAIWAWKDYGLGILVNDPAVTMTPIDVPGDGRFWLASRVVQVNTTTWHYEYALQNLNSNRAAQSFGVSFGGGMLSNPGLHNVPSHSGEIWDPTAWTSPIPGPPSLGVARWGTVQSPNANPRGNALRWGTMFTMWFDANLAPATGQATIVLFGGVAGEPISVRVAAPTPGGGTPGPLANDDCASAFTIGREPFGFSNLGALDSAPALAECASTGGSTNISNDVWFKYTHTGIAGIMTVSTCGSAFNTKLVVYSGSTCPTAGGTAIACNDDSTAAAPGGCGAGSTSSLVNVTVSPGQTYLIRVGGSPAAAASNRVGNGVLTLTPPPLPTGACCHVDGSCLITRPAACNATYLGDGAGCTPNPCPQPPPPANDLCANAQWIGDGVPITATNNHALTDGASPACGNGGAKDVWYKYKPMVSGNVRISTDNAAPPTGGSTDLDTVLAVFTACGGAVVECDDDGGVSPEISSDIAAVPLTAGQTYLIRVAAYPYMDETRQVGVFTLKVAGGGGTVPVPGACCTGSACAAATQETCTGGSTFQGANTTCGTPGNPTTCCPANFNQIGGVTVQDIFDFLTFYFFGISIADINHDGTVSVQDVFDFLVFYFRGCPG